MPPGVLFLGQVLQLTVAATRTRHEILSESYLPTRERAHAAHIGRPGRSRALTLSAGISVSLENSPVRADGAANFVRPPLCAFVGLIYIVDIYDKTGSKYRCSNNNKTRPRSFNYHIPARDDTACHHESERRRHHHHHLRHGDALVLFFLRPPQAMTSLPTLPVSTSHRLSSHL